MDGNDSIENVHCSAPASFKCRGGISFFYLPHLGDGICDVFIGAVCGTLIQYGRDLWMAL